MPFPRSEKVIYQKPPLGEAICQLRFPANLRIEAQPPIDFQDAVGELFPIYKQESQPKIERQVFESLGSQIELPMSRAHRFETGDGQSFLTLAKDFIAMTALGDSYERWRAFKERLSHVVGALERLYSPAFYTRIGLRYRNVIVREKIGLKGTNWSDLLPDYIAGELGRDELRDHIYGRGVEITIKLDSDAREPTPNGKPSFITLRHALGTLKDDPKIAAFLIDMDLYNDGRTEKSDAFERLDEFNDKAARAFRWSIGDRLHDALEPRSAD